jgi:hypothetical protein
MLVASIFSAISERTGDDATTTSLSTLFDLLTPPALIAMAIAILKFGVHRRGSTTAPD